MGFEVTNSLDKRLDWVMFGGRKMFLVSVFRQRSSYPRLRKVFRQRLESLDKAQDTHGLKQSLDRDLRFKVTNPLDKILD
ncbi:hypothetical protein AT4G31405 [Arabidopsis thaliana]|uniref:Uncharacterized protein n=1 Tax=Arabidopsis thaliana TaxID=3702 RepID=A0A1P8B3I7_ARATH|nr:uncharacterized protein AT4G31405 [Arabidopsis thaliana]ANM66142.1 hypothetical protein AT4G31405 [Arabidopsis thaliana]|eukprot:NP_001328056.1 hypothetical protein AT4G31405 [Arabidopsis thaliana]